MDETQIGYIAGIFELKGKLHTRRVNMLHTYKNGKPWQATEYRITINYNCLEALQAIVGFCLKQGGYTWTKQAYIGKRRDFYRLELYGEMACRLIRAITPHIRNSDLKAELEEAIQEAGDYF